MRRHHEHALDGGALCHRLVHRRLERQHLTPAEAAVGGDHRFGVAVDDALGEGLGAEAAENHRVGGADAGTGQHRHRRLRDHRQVDGNAVTFADPLALQHVGELADLAQHVVVGQYPAVAGLALPEERHLVAEPAGDLLVEGIVGKVGLAADEPLHERLIPLVHRAPALEPVKFAGNAFPEAIRIVERLLVELLILFDTAEFGGSPKAF